MAFGVTPTPLKRDGWAVAARQDICLAQPPATGACGRVRAGTKYHPHGMANRRKCLSVTTGLQQSTGFAYHGRVTQMNRLWNRLCAAERGRWKRRSAAVFRMVTLSVTLFLVGIFGFALKIAPERGVNLDAEWKMWPYILAYLFVVAIPHRWIVRSRLAFIIVTALLALPLLVYLKLFADAIVKTWQEPVGPGAYRLLFHPTNLACAATFILFWLMFPLSLYLSWKFRHRVQNRGRVEEIQP